MLVRGSMFCKCFDLLILPSAPFLLQLLVGRVRLANPGIPWPAGQPLSGILLVMVIERFLNTDR